MSNHPGRGAAPGGIEGHDVTGVRLLVAVVDDDDSVRRALQRLLRSAGFEVETFCGGVTFLQSLRSRRTDCVVLDLDMPGASWDEGTRHRRRSEGDSMRSIRTTSTAIIEQIKVNLRDRYRGGRYW